MPVLRQSHAFEGVGGAPAQLDVGDLAVTQRPERDTASLDSDTAASARSTHPAHSNDCARRSVDELHRFKAALVEILEAAADEGKASRVPAIHGRIRSIGLGVIDL